MTASHSFALDAPHEIARIHGAATPLCRHLHRSKHFPLDPRSVRKARAFVAGTLELWQATERLDDAVECTSELATNAVNALGHNFPTADGFTVTVDLDVREHELRVEVHDRAEGKPAERTAAAEDEHGRGLLLVSHLADDWDTEPRPSGKVVRCSFHLTGNVAPSEEEGVE